MYIPCRRELEDLFKSDRSIWLKMLGGAFVMDLALVHVFLRGNDFGGRTLAAVIVVTATALGAFGGLLLGLKDVVRRRLSCGEPVNTILKLYLGMGVWSLALWFFTVWAIGLAIAAAVSQ